MVRCVLPRAFSAAPFVLALGAAVGCGARTGVRSTEARDAVATSPDASDTPDASDGPALSCEPGATRKCYSGSPATRGLGECRDGLETCEPALDGGFAWGPCIGEVLPTPELCDDADHLCLGHPNPACVCHRDATRRCYTGPPGTEGVGECRAGTQTCVATSSGSGSMWGPCEGEVLPAAPACDGRDHACRGVIARCEVEVRCPEAMRVRVGASVTLTATATASPPLTVVSTLWTVPASPPGSSPRLDRPTSLSTTFSANAAGAYRAAFTATGSNMRTATCTVPVTVSEP